MNCRSIITALAAGIMLWGCSSTPGALPTGNSALADRHVSSQMRSSDQILFVANNPSVHHGDGNVTVYDPSTGRLLQTIQDGIGTSPTSLAVDAAGDLFVANYEENNVQEYAPGVSSPTQTITQGVKKPFVLALDSVGNLYVGGKQSVTVYAPGTNSLMATITEHITSVRALAFDSSGNLYVANAFGGNRHFRSDVLVYASSTFSFLRKLTAGVNFSHKSFSGMLFDRKNNLYLMNDLGNSVTVYANGEQLIETISKGVTSPVALAVDSAGRLYVANSLSGVVEVYAAGKTLPSRTITQGIATPLSLLFSNSGRLFVGNVSFPNSSGGKGSVTVYSPQKDSLLLSIYAGLHEPVAMAFGPKV